ncbi:uncharacterized protein LOC123543365 [Mercenaria mercenaria]|uniref:uncharacterized protein LOC123543365 n=1 Tax=Mercenaria mercenaria TaxID=6596 RepID=UPI00234EFAC7|nr:uncharacterized protein LOC123543365 [Mercenaria mercenaria]
MSWCFLEEDSFIYVLELKSMKKTTVVTRVKSSGVAGNVMYTLNYHFHFSALQVSFVEGEKREYSLRNFKPSRNQLSEKFKDCLSSRSSFVSTFNDVVTTLRDSSCCDHTDSSSTQSEGSMSSVMALSVESDVSNSESETSTEQSSKVECVSVHLDNLVGPMDGRAVRPVLTSHVKELEEAFLKNRVQSQYKILVGLLVDGSIEMASKPGGCTVEVLGGNHTRIALQTLRKRGLWKLDELRVEVHANIDDQECLSLGIQHNVVDKQALEMCFMDEVRLIRKLMTSNPSQAREAMRHVFNLKNITEVRHNLKTHEGVAKVSDDVWMKVLEVEAKWKEKKPMKQTFFTSWLKVKDEEKRKRLLDTYLKEGLTNYKESVRSLTQVNKSCPVTIQEDADSEKDIHQVELLSKENEILKKAVQEKEAVIVKLEEECNRLREMMKSQISTDSTGKTKNSISVEKRQRVESEEVKSRKKVKFTSDGVSVGDVVWARYVDGIAYPAKVMKFSASTQKYTVRYVEDGVVTEVSDMDIKQKK